MQSKLTFNNSADLALYYENNRAKIIEVFLQKHKPSLKKVELFTNETRKLAEKFFEEYLLSEGISMQGCDCQLSRLAHFILFSIQDEIEV